MQVSSRFTIALHMLTCIGTFSDEYQVSSEFMASSVNVNPVVIRRILGQLKKAGMVTVTRGGQGRAEFAMDPDEITLLDVFRAVESLDDDMLFHFHEDPSDTCPVGRNIHTILDTRLYTVQKAMEDSLESMTVGDLIADAQDCILQEALKRFGQ